MTFIKINGYVPACVKCGKDVSVEELDSLKEDSEIGVLDWYIHKACLIKIQAKKSKKKKV